MDLPCYSDDQTCQLNGNIKLDTITVMVIEKEEKTTSARLLRCDRYLHIGGLYEHSTQLWCARVSSTWKDRPAATRQKRYEVFSP